MNVLLHVTPGGTGPGSHLKHSAAVGADIAPGDAILQRCAFLRAAPGTAGTAQRSGHDVATVAIVPVALCRKISRTLIWHPATVFHKTNACSILQEPLGISSEAQSLWTTHLRGQASPVSNGGWLTQTLLAKASLQRGALRALSIAITCNHKTAKHAGASRLHCDPFIEDGGRHTMAIFEPRVAGSGTAVTCHRPGVLRTCCSDLTSSIFTRSAFHNCQPCPCRSALKAGEHHEAVVSHRPRKSQGSWRHVEKPRP